MSAIILVGPMGSGKSTIGRQLATALKKEFRDSDHEIVARTGASIPLIFEIEGEEGFRKREAAMLDELTQLDGIVLATGGGAVLREENRQHLAQRGVVIYLYASVEQLFERTARDRNRPLLQTENPRQKLQQLMEQRDPLYREVADMVVHTDDRSIRSVVKEILVRLRQEPKYGGG
ncbi:MAG: shikimate kinase AroK [Gammaproteobacteria bacterium]|nr:shikimate kinase AroK [Gammaproteobacteria bacterium]